MRDFLLYMATMVSIISLSVFILTKTTQVEVPDKFIDNILNIVGK